MYYMRHLERKEAVSIASSLIITDNKMANANRLGRRYGHVKLATFRVALCAVVGVMILYHVQIRVTNP